MRYLFMEIERDPEASWLVIRSERREILLEDGVDFYDWARHQSEADHLERKLLYATSA